MNTHIALLRGVNVGGNHKLPMKELARIFEESGASNVATFIQSGNVIFDSEADSATDIAVLARQQISERFSFDAPIILRTASEMAAVCESNPFKTSDEPESRLYVMFLDKIPSTDKVAQLDPEKFLPDRFKVVGKEIYLSLPTGAGTTKLTNAYFDKALGMISTSRNWRSTCTLATLASR